MGEKRYAFPRSRRLSGKRAFAAVYATGAKQARGPLVVFTLANGLAHCRWGLSVPRAVGTAVRRNRIKRLLREAIRLLQHDLPRGYDVIIVVRPHEPMILTEYQRLLSDLMVQGHAAQDKMS